MPRYVYNRSRSEYSELHRKYCKASYMTDLDLLYYSDEDNCINQNEYNIESLIETKSTLDHKNSPYKSLEEFEKSVQNRINMKCAEALQIPYFFIVERGRFRGEYPMNNKSRDVHERNLSIMEYCQRYPYFDGEEEIYIEYRYKNDMLKVAAVILAGRAPYKFKDSEKSISTIISKALNTNLYFVEYSIKHKSSNNRFEPLMECKDTFWFNITDITKGKEFSLNYLEHRKWVHNL